MMSQQLPKLLPSQIRLGAHLSQLHLKLYECLFRENSTECERLYHLTISFFNRVWAKSSTVGQSHGESGTEVLKCLNIFILILTIGNSCAMHPIIVAKHAVNHSLPKPPDTTGEFRFYLILFLCIYLFPLELEGYCIYYKTLSSNYRHLTALGPQHPFTLES